MLAIVIVSWNVRDLLQRCIATIHGSLESSSINYWIVVVDNASSDGTPALVRQNHPEVALIDSGTNLGFAGGNNLALRMLLAETNPPDYVLILNPDTEIVADAIPRMVRYLIDHPDVAVVGPRLRYSDGSNQSSRRRFPTAGVFFWESTPLEQRWPSNPWARQYRYADTPDHVTQAVDWLVGAALLVRRAAIERAGLLDERFVMYSEELEWQQRLAAAHVGKIVYLPEAEIIHYEGKSSEQALARRYINFQRSRLRYARMSSGMLIAVALRLFLLAAYGIELLIEAAKWVLGHRRDMRARRVAVYAELLGALLDIRR